MTQKLLKDVFLDEWKDILVEKIFSESENKFTFALYDVSHSIFPRDDYKQYGVGKFKQIAYYSFNDKEVDKFNEFLEKLHRKTNIARSFFTEHDNIFSLSKTNPDEESKLIKNPYDYEFLKIHVSLNAKIASKKQEEFVNNHLKYDPKTIGNKVYMGDWIHLFIGLYSPSMLDALKINEVELDTSVILNKNNRDDEVESTWRNIQAGLIAVRH